MSIVSPSVLPGNILILADSDFETGSPSWAAYTNANTPAASGASFFTGAHSLVWTATATAASTIVATGFYPCMPNSGYAVSGLLFTSNTHDAYIGIAWFTSGGSLISTSWGNDYTTTASTWQPLNAAVTSPPTAAKFKLLAQAATGVTIGESFSIDLMYAARTNVQVLIDWINPAFSAGSIAGADFLDMTPWVRLQDDVTMLRGRQNGVDEIQTGSAAFTLQNDMGWFTQSNTGSPIVALGGIVDLGARSQINITDEVGAWHTRFDGPVAEIDYAIDPVGNTNIASVVLADVLAFLSRQTVMTPWVKSAVMASSPWLHWTLDDSANAGETGIAAETSGNNGPALLPLSASGLGTITWGGSAGGVETLADAARAGYNAGADGWPTGAKLNPIIGSGLESLNVGPYTTPLSSAYFDPSIVVGGIQDVFVDNAGYALTGRLNSQIGKILTTTGNNYTIEAWLAANTGLVPYFNQNVGPFTVFYINSSRTASAFAFGLYPTGSNVIAQLATYLFSPTLNNFGIYPVIQQSTSTPFTNDVYASLPHHVVVTITGANTGATARLWYDGVNVGSVTLPAGAIFDTVSVGGAYGGWGAFFGNIQLVSIYQRVLPANEIYQHCQLGQYGMWEAPTDVCVSQIAKFSGMPQFWNALTDDYDGLTLTDYYNIGGKTPLSNMQAYEAAERGLLYVAADGKLKFATRDWRMGYGAPDLQLPPDTYSESFGYRIIDQFVVNQSTLTTSIYQRVLTWQQASSESRYGNYPATGTFPLISWNRAGGALGLTQYLYSPDPALNDNASWQVNVNANSRLTFSSLTFDLLTLDTNDGIAISQLYALDINNMVALSGATPATMANATGVNELFIEGVQETIGLTKRTLLFYTSPAAAQRAWIPGDTTYGLVGSTARIGISQPDYNPVPAIAKQVPHDAGAPYWTPSFTTPIISDVRQVTWDNFTGTTATFGLTVGTGKTYQGECILVFVMCAAASTITVSDNGGNTYSAVTSKSITGGIQYVFASVTSLPLNNAATFTVTGSVSQAYTVGIAAVPNVTAVDVTNTANGASTAPSVSISGMTTLYDIEVALFFNFSSLPITAMPAGCAYVDQYFQGTAYNVAVWKQSAGATTDTITAAYGSSITWGAILLTLKVSGVTQNNPSGNGHQFVGALETRGLHDSLATALEPPMMAVSQHSQQTMPSGNDATPQVLWTGVDLDSANGVGAVPSWSNWYVCTVPGFYELSGQVVYQSHISGSGGIRTGYFAVAAQGARNIASGAATPITNGNYVNIIAEQHQANTSGIQPVLSPSTRIYLGLGDMVGLCTTQNQGSSDQTGITGVVSAMQARWCGYSTTNDQVMLNDTIGAAGTLTVWPTNALQLATSASSISRTYTQTWASNNSRSYYGSAATLGANVLRSTGGTVYQGQASTLTGTQFSFVMFPYATIQAALSGATVLSVVLSFTTTGGYYASGLAAQLGWSTQTSWGSPYAFGATDHPNYQTLRLKPNASISIQLNNWANIFATSATSLIVGDNQTTAPIYSGQFGATWNLTITYTK